MNRIEPQTVVEVDGKRGVTCPDIMSCCAEWETPVVFDGESSFQGIQTDRLTIIGPENAVITDPEKCGAGLGRDCCIFLTCGPKGFECDRFGDLRFQLIMKSGSFTAKRKPTAMFPLCQIKESR